jgi:mRNA interferase MazF
MPYEFGTIVLVPFPFTNQSASKRRPAVIVSNPAYNMARQDVVVMAITGQLRASPVLGDVWVSQWQQAGLLKPSAVKPVFATIEHSLVIRELGTLAPADQVALRKAITDIIG